MDLVKDLLKTHFFYTLPSDVQCSTDVRSLLLARMSGHFRTSGVPQHKHFYGCPEPFGRPTLSQQKHFYGRPDPPVVRAPDVQPSSDVRILYTGLWVTLFTAAGHPMTVGRPDPFGPPDVQRSPDVRSSCTPNGHFFPPPIYTPFPPTG